MFVDARQLPQEEFLTDICIVGGGAAGITLARQLADTALSCILLESGGFELDEQTQALAGGENASFKPFALETTRLRFFGGTTNHWGGETYRLDAEDLAARPDMPFSSWPIPASELARFYPAAEDICQLGGAQWDRNDAWQRATGHEPLHMPRGMVEPHVVFCSLPTRFGSAYRADLAGARNVKVLLHANAREIIANDSATHAERVTVQCFGGKRFSVTARAFVLAVGGLEAPRLLLLSRAQRPAGLGNQHDLVGRFYMDHPGISGALLLFAPRAPDYGFFETRVPVQGRHVTGFFLPRPGLVEREGIGNFRVGLDPAEAETVAGSLRSLERIASDADARAAFGRNLANVLLDIDQVANLAYKNLVDPHGALVAEKLRRDDGRAAWCSVFAEQFPNPDSRVTLTEESDAFGQPKLRLDWRLQAVDYRTLRRATEIFAASVAACGHGRVRLTDALHQPEFPELVDISCHPMGTTRMSADPRSGVVDPNLCVHGMDNLFVCSSSTFPTGSWKNPTLTIVALAVRLAAHLRQQLV